MMAEVIPAVSWWVGVIEMSSSPASRNPSSYSQNDSAPAMQPSVRALLHTLGG